MTHENMYNLTLGQQTETAQRLLNDVQLQQTGAVALQNGRLEVTADQYQAARAEMEAILPVNPRPNTELLTKRVNTAAETDVPLVEKMRGIVSRSGIAVNTYMNNEVIAGLPMRITFLHNGTVTQQEANQLAGYRTDSLPLIELNVQGVSEIVTFSDLADSYHAKKIPGHNDKGRVTVVSYESTDQANNLPFNALRFADREKYHGKNRRYPMGFDKEARGAAFSYHLFMNPEDADTLRAVISEHPEAIHQFNEVIMTEAFGADPEGFRRKGPQYDEWRKSDNGHSKLAIRDSLKAPAKESQIIDF